MEEDVLNEFRYYSLIRDKLETLKRIKETDKSEYDGPKEVKKFVDKNYDDIKKCVELLQEEQKGINKISLAWAINMVISILGALVTINVADFAFLLSLLWGIIASIVSIILINVRANDNVNATEDLLEIKGLLKKIKGRKGVSDNVVNKIDDLIEDIEKIENKYIRIYKK